MKLSIRYQVLLIIAVVLVVFYSALSATINSVDDTHIMAVFGMGDGKGLSEIFKPEGGYYYRPLVELSYYLDNIFWGMHARFMHLENVLFHLLNAVLVFFVSGQIAKAWSIKMPWFPLASALLFAVHPINTEAVTWIAGRTDPLASIFIFGAFWCLFRCLITDRFFYLIPSLLLFFLGMLTKEITICFLPAAVLITYYWPNASRFRPTTLKVLASVSVSIFLISLVFVIFSRNFSMIALMNSETGGVLAFLQNICTALGFYIKKLFIPLPLNFAIDSVSQLYLIPGVIILLTLPLWLRMHSIPVLLAIVGLFFLIPALIISTLQVAWTPYAERYLYIPSAFFCMVIVSGSSHLLAKMKLPQFCPALVLILVTIASSLTMQRNLVWQDNLTLYQDTVSKSPEFGAVYLELGIALLQNGRLNDGRIAFEKAEKFNRRPSLNNLIKTNLMAVMIQEKDYLGACKYFYEINQEKVKADISFLRLLNKADEGLANQEKDINAKDILYKDMIDTYDILYRKTDDPFYLYQGGLLAYRRGDKDKALAYITKVINEAPQNTHYTASAIKWHKRLEHLQ